LPRAVFLQRTIQQKGQRRHKHMRSHAIIFVVVDGSHFQQPFEMSKAALDFIQLFISHDRLDG
jgi:hypothetical protein